MTTNIMPADDSRGLGLPVPPAWYADALCAQVGGDLHFPDRGRSAETRAAKRVCSACSVISSCLEYALQRSDDGVWGGTTPRERQRMRRVA